MFSYTQPRENILSYAPWRIVTANADSKGVEFKVIDGRVQGKGLVAKLDGVEDRDAAALLAGAEIYVSGQRLGALGRDQYYWSDLIGLKVQTTDGQALGAVDSLMETGANDVLVVEGERRRLVPFLIDDVVASVDLKARMIVVDWDPDF